MIIFLNILVNQFPNAWECSKKEKEEKECTNAIKFVWLQYPLKVSNGESVLQ